MTIYFNYILGGLDKVSTALLFQYLAAPKCPGKLARGLKKDSTIILRIIKFEINISVTIDLIF